MPNDPFTPKVTRARLNVHGIFTCFTALTILYIKSLERSHSNLDQIGRNDFNWSGKFVKKVSKLENVRLYIQIILLLKENASINIIDLA